MTKQHPITPPPDELVEQWREENLTPKNLANYVATQAARWGADQELEACIDAILAHPGFESPELFVELLRAARRPKPPSLKEQALMALEDGDIGPGASLTPVEVCIIRRALEQLDD